jgi:hypothetical protein
MAEQEAREPAVAVHEGVDQDEAGGRELAGHREVVAARREPLDRSLLRRSFQRKRAEADGDPQMLAAQGPEHGLSSGVADFLAF